MLFLYFQKDIETMGRKELEKLQLERLKHIVKYCYDNVKFYHDRLDKINFNPDKIKTLKDIEYIPYTTKEDIRDNYPYGLFAVDRKKIVRIHASSGTTGKPTVVGYTRNDLNMWSDIVARLVTAAGVTDEDTVQISFGYGLFTGALGLHYGLEKVGASVIPISSGNTQKQIMVMKDFGTTALVSTPSYALYMFESAKEMGITKEELKLKTGLFGSEGCTPEMRNQIENTYGIFATDNYGMSELVGPGVSGECTYRCGMHIAEDHFLPEIIDSNTLEVLKPGQTGEVVFTTLTKEGFPLLRYRTKDISRLDYEICKCGRTHARMDKIKGRSDDMLKIRGVNVFPSQIESVITSIEGTSPHYQLVVRHEGYFDTLEVKIEITNEDMLERYSSLIEFQNYIKDQLKSILGINCKVSFVEPKSLERFEGKAKRILDLRNS